LHIIILYAQDSRVYEQIADDATAFTAVAVACVVNNNI